MTVIRRLQEGDESEWLRMRRALWPEPEYVVEELKQEMRNIRNDPQQPVFVAERPDGNGLCGMLEVSIRTSAPECTTDRIGFLEGWYVDVEFRKSGIGGQLVAAAEAWARAMGCHEMASDTTPDYPTSPAAHAALGYSEVARFFRKELD